MLLPADPEQDFASYLESLEALAPAALRRRALPAAPSRDALLAHLAVQRPRQLPDEADIERALELLEDPARLKSTVTGHLRSLWTRLLAEEWRRK